MSRPSRRSCSAARAWPAASRRPAFLGRPGLDLALVGGSETASRVQIGLSQDFSVGLRRVLQARSAAQAAGGAAGDPAARHPPLRPPDQEPRDRQEHGRALRGDGEGVEDRPARAGRVRPREPSAGHRGPGRRIPAGHRAGGRSRARPVPAPRHLARKAREAAARLRPGPRHDHRGKQLAADRRRGGRSGSRPTRVSRAFPRRRRASGWSTSRWRPSTSSTRVCSWRRWSRSRGCWRATA